MGRSLSNASIAAVVVSYSAPVAVVQRCVDSITAAGADDLIVVDNGTDDERLATLRRARIVRTDNRGYGAGVNIGVAHAATASYLFILNDDVVVAPDALKHLTDAMAEHECGVAQPMLVVADTEPAIVNSLGVELGSDGAGVDIGDGQPVSAVERATRSVSIFTGGAFLCSREFWLAVGGFDERYELYYEDVDLALRGAEAGWRYVVAPRAVIHHDRGRSTSQLADRTRFLQERNRLWVAARFGSRERLAAAVGLSLRRLRHRPRRTHARALIAGLTGMPRCRIERRRAR